MRRFLFVMLLMLFAALQSVYGQYSLSGKLLVAEKKVPLEFATIATPDNSFWAVTNFNGEFTIELPSGENTLVISCLGYEKTTIKVTIKDQSLNNQVFYVRENNLALEEVVVTAQKKDEMSTSYSLGENALTHAQVKDVSDLMSQLPGGQTAYESDMTGSQNIVLRGDASGGIEENVSFGTAIEVDGVRLSSNSNFSHTDASDGIDGIDIRNVAVNNIESVEVLTGLPSVENGDLTAGMVKIHTKKGKSPFVVEAVTKPNTKSYSLTKGFDLGGKRGVLNASAEHTKTIRDRVSPYTTYTRNNLSLTYRNTFGSKERPLELTYGLTGNIGGREVEVDPDLYAGDYEKQKDYVLRTNLNLKWLVNLPWLTGVDFTTYVNYANRQKEEQTNEDQSVYKASLHTSSEGYFLSQDYDENPDAAITLVPNGYYYLLKYDEDKPITYVAKLKLNWLKKAGDFVNKAKVGGEFEYAGNYGRGIYYDDMLYAPTWREYRYDKQPFVKTYSFFVEDKVIFPVFGNQFEFQAGVRSDITSIKGSDYGTVQGWSPRINAQYMLHSDNSTFVKFAKLHVSWGDAIKLPSASVLYPKPDYYDKQVFSTTTDENGYATYGYYTTPLTTIYNSDLKWQRRRKMEVGVDFKLGGTKVSLTAYRDKTFNPYMEADTYVPISYKQTDQTALGNCTIPDEDQVYSIDQTTGIVTVSDATGTYASETLSYTEKNAFKQTSYYTNGSSVVRKGLEWMVDFGKIKALKTSVRFDGSYYHYKKANQTIVEGCSTGALSADNSPYKYVGFYVGNYGVTNGWETKKLRANVTVTTHIPAIRMIVSCKFESCLYDYRQRLSEYNGGTRSYVLDDKDSYVPSSSDESIYDGNHYVATYPVYYKSIDDMDTEIPFLEKYLWAKDNDEDLYNDLTKLVKKSSSDYYFKARKYNPYFTANINLTKEIGEHFSITFQATNFFNNVGTVYNSQTGNDESLYKDGSGKISNFYYGLSMRVKL